MSSAFFCCLKVFLRNFKNEYNEIKIQMKFMNCRFPMLRIDMRLKKQYKNLEKKYYLKIDFSAKYFVVVIIVEMYTCKSK